MEDSEVNPLVGSFSLLSSLRDLLLSHRQALRQERPFRRMQALLLGHLFSFARHTITQALVALVYLGSAALDRYWSAWVVLLAGLPVVGGCYCGSPSLRLAGLTGLGSSTRAIAQARRPHAPGRRHARLRRDRVGDSLRGYGAWCLSRGRSPPRPRRLGRLPLPARQGGRTFVRGVLRSSRPRFGRGHPLVPGVVGPHLRDRTYRGVLHGRRVRSWMRTSENPIQAKFREFNYYQSSVRCLGRALVSNYPTFTQWKGKIPANSQ